MRQVIREAFRQHFLFKDVPPDIQEEAIDVMRKQVVRKGDIVVREGEHGSRFFVLVSGTCAVTIAGQGKVNEIHEGESFGELALLMSKRKATVSPSSSSCELWYLDKDSWSKEWDKHVRIYCTACLCLCVYDLFVSTVTHGSHNTLAFC